MQEFADGVYHFDSLPGTGTIETGHVLRGWVVTKQRQPFVDLRITCAAAELASVYGLPRADLAQVFAARRTFLPAAFECTLGLSPGEFDLRLEAFDITGEWRLVTTVHLSVVASQQSVSPPSPAATPSPLRAHEFSRALRALLRNPDRGDSPRDGISTATRLARATPWPPAVRHPHRPFHGFLDEPAAISRCDYGRVAISGWLFHETVSIRRVVASFDLIGFEPIEHGGEFAGVTARYPDFPLAVSSRLRGAVDAPSQLAARACLRVYAELPDGSWHLCHVQRTSWLDVEQEKRPFHSSSIRSFLEGARLLRRAYHDASIPLETRFTMRGELWTTWREYSAQAPHGPVAAVAKISPLPLAAPASRANENPRRLLVVTHNLALEGASLFLYEYAQQWHRAGVPVSVISGSDGPLRARYENLKADIRIVATGALARAGTAAALRKKISELGESIDWRAGDLVVINTLACYWAVHAAHAAGRPTLFYIHESTTPARFFLSHLPADALPVVEEAFALATRVSFLAETTRRYYAPFCRNNSVINPGWLDLAPLNAFRARHSATREEGRRRLVVNVGTVCDRKGQTLFARMVELLWQWDPQTAASCQFTIVGARHSPYDAALAALVRDFDRPNLQVIPETADVFTWYAAADVFVCTSFEESFPRVVLEAMGFGLGIVSTGVHAIPTITREGQEALLFPAGDTGAGAAALLRLLVDPAMKKQLASAARRRVESEYALDRVFPGHQALARSVLSSP